MSINSQESDPEAALADSNEGDWISLHSLGIQSNDSDRRLSDYPVLSSVLPEEIVTAALQRHERNAPHGYQHERTSSISEIKKESKDFHNEIRSLRNRIDMRLHKAAAAQDLMAIEQLLDSGVSPSSLNPVGLTPLHFCISRKLIKPFEVLLRREESSNLSDAGGLSVLHVAVLHQWLPGVKAALKAGAKVTALCNARKTLLPQTRPRYPNVLNQELILALQQTPIHLASKGDKNILVTILKNATKEVLNCGNVKGETPLYTAIKNSNLEAVKILLDKGASTEQISNRNESALHIAVSKPVILKYLLSVPNIANSNTFSDYGYKPLHEAVFCNQPDSVKLLLGRFNDLTVTTRKTSEEDNNYGLMALHLAVKHCNNETAKVLLENGANPNDVDVNKNTSLHIAANNMNRAASTLLLRNGALLSAKDKNDNSALQIISSKFDDALSFFELLFDDCICYKELNILKTSSVHVNYEVISRNNDQSQIKTVEEFVKCGLRKLLLHPFIESLLYLKWKQYLSIFYALVIIYMIFIASFNMFIVNYYLIKDNCTNMNTTSTFNVTKNTRELTVFEMYDMWYYFLLALIFTSMSLLVLQEIFYIYLKKQRYFFIMESWVKLAALVLAAGLPLTLHFGIMAEWNRNVACASLLLIWIQAMILLSRFPEWGYYVLMLGRVSTTMFKVFVSAIGLVMGFAFCFMILFQSTPPFNGPASAIVKTFIMMTSEFEYEESFGENHIVLENSRPIVLFLFLIFVIFVATVLMNFMIAVAVSDINALTIAGNINRLEKQVDLLSSLDDFVNIGPLAKVFKKKYGGKAYHVDMYNSIKENKTWLVKDSSQKTLPQVFPSILHRAILETARMKHERAKKENYKNTILNKLHSIEDALIGKQIHKQTQKERNLKESENEIMNYPEYT